MTQTPVTSSEPGRTRVRRRSVYVLMLLAAGALGATTLAAQSASEAPHATSIPVAQMFTFLFLMLGPIKVIGPYAGLTRSADPALARRLALRATAYATVAVLLAALVGQSMLERYAIPVPVLSLAGGVILFLVALQTIMQQFNPLPHDSGPASPPSLAMAMTPLAFPTIVTPHGIAAIIVFMSLSPDVNGKVTVAVIVLAIMVLNFAAMLAAKHILKFLGVFLQLLGSVLGIIQVALGLSIIMSALKRVWG